MKESVISKEVQSFLKMVGFSVYSVEQGYRKERGGTRQTPGIPDLIVIGHGTVLFVELKTAKAKLRDSQAAFRDVCAENDVPWALWRSVHDAWDWCVNQGIIEER